MGNIVLSSDVVRCGPWCCVEDGHMAYGYTYRQEKRALSTAILCRCTSGAGTRTQYGPIPRVVSRVHDTYGENNETGHFSSQIQPTIVKPEHHFSSFPLPRSVVM